MVRTKEPYRCVAMARLNGMRVRPGEIVLSSEALGPHFVRVDKDKEPVDYESYRMRPPEPAQWDPWSELNKGE